MIRPEATGVVFRNPKPYLAAIHAWHPSLVQVKTGELLVSFDLGQGAESLDYHTCLARSYDGGETWSSPAPLLASGATDRAGLEFYPSGGSGLAQSPAGGRGSAPKGSPRRSTHSVRLGTVSDGTIVGCGGRFYRDDPEEGLVNRANLGYVPMELFLVRSGDGKAWEGPEPIRPPLVGPAFEMCHRIIELADGRWLAPTSTWKGWNGDAPHGMQAIALVSHDRGQSWPEYLRVIDQTRRGVISWEQGLAQLPDGRLVAVVWSFEEATGKSLPNRYAVSFDGRNFFPSRENGLLGETAKLLTLDDGRLLCLYRRLDKPGLWANLVRIDGEDWINLEEAPLWQGTTSGMTGARRAGDELSALKFGYPSIIELRPGVVLAVFWCVEDCLHIIRWQRLKIE